MKSVAFVVTAFILVSGGLSVSFSKTENTTTVRIGMDEPEKAAQAAGTFVSEIRSSLQSEGEYNAGTCNETVQTIYRIRNADCDPVSQIGAYYDRDTAISMCLQGYCVYDQYGTLIYSNE